LWVNLHFLLTPWASSADEQLWLLGWVMSTLQDTPLLTPELLNASSPQPGAFGPTETVALSYEPLALSDLALIWQGLGQPRILPSLTYLARGLHVGQAVSLSSP
jgi:hypothetical protein